MLNEYSVGDLKEIVTNYYDSFDEDTDGKMDFDNALNAIGKGHWIRELDSFKSYKGFSKYQRLIIADILGIPPEETGINYAPQLRGRAYGKLCKALNTPDEL